MLIRDIAGMIVKIFYECRHFEDALSAAPQHTFIAYWRILVTDTIDWNDHGYPSNIRPFPNTKDLWQQDHISDALTQINNATERAAQQRIDWYDDKASSFGRLARRMRFAALSLAGVGALAPLVSPILRSLFPVSADTIAPGEAVAHIKASWITELNGIGIAMIATAGVIVGFDNFFGISESWMRYRSVQAKLVRRLASFKYEWTIALTRLPDQLAATDCTPLLRTQQAFVDDLEAAIEVETSQWADGLQTRLMMFDKSKGFSRYENETGSVVGKIANWDDVATRNVSMTLDGSPVALGTDGKFAVNDLAVGAHDLLLTVDQKPTAQQVTIASGETARVSLLGVTD